MSDTNDTILFKDKIPPQGTLRSLLDHYQAGRYSDAEKLALSISKEFPNHPFSWKVLGSILRTTGRTSESLVCNKKVVELNPEDATAHNNLGNTLNSLDMLGEAEESYRQAITLKPDYAEAYNNLGNTLKELGRTEDALASYNKAIAINPDFSEAYYNLGLFFFEASEYEKAIEHFKETDFKKSKHYLLRCLYLQDEKSLFYDQLDYSIKKGEIDPMVGSLVCRSELRYGIKKTNLFCSDPLNYVLKTDLSDQYDFEKIFSTVTKTILSRSIPIKEHGLLTNGYKTSGDLFDIESDLTDKIKKIILLELEKYRVYFKNSEEGLITNWPNDFTLYGWLINMKNGGKLSPHMHERGWISGSIYINIPPKSNIDSGNLVVCIEDEKLMTVSSNQKKSIDVVTGSLCLFPSSLLHYTIPFESDEERIVLAFDIIPK